jgi:pyruvate,water dikinase
MGSTDIIGWFADIGLHDRPRVGGKGGSLGELQRAGIDVPAGFVVKTGAFECFLQALERQAPLRSRIEALDPDNLLTLTACCREVRAWIEQTPLPAEVSDAISSAHRALCAGEAHESPVAVRSSATTEDALDASFAGLQDTYLWVTSLEQTLHKVRSCWASLYSVESVAYRLERGLPEAGVAMAVVIQKMVDARTAGVMFTRSPVSGDRSVITIEGAWGLGSAVVGGEVTPDRWVVSKVTGEITAREVSEKLIQHRPRPGGGIEALAVPEPLRCIPCLSDDELDTLRNIGRSVERHYGRPQDIEWAVEDHTRKILLLQSRPETVWSAKEPVPLAQAAQDPLQHVMSIFGGRQ